MDVNPLLVTVLIWGKIRQLHAGTRLYCDGESRKIQPEA